MSLTDSNENSSEIVELNMTTAYCARVSALLISRAEAQVSSRVRAFLGPGQSCGESGA